MEKNWKDEYVNLIGDMKFSKLQKEKMVHFLMNADNQGEGSNMGISEKKKTGISLSLKRLAVAGICICVLTAGTATIGAAGLLKPVSEVFGNIFHLNKDTSKIVEEMGNSLNISDSSAGVKMTADAVVGDEYNYAVVFSLKSKDGTPFKSIMENAPMDKWCFDSENFEIDPAPSSSASWGDSYFHNSGSKDSSVQFVYIVSMDKKVNNQKIAVEFSDLGYYDDNGEFVKVLDGNWKLELQTDLPDSTVELQAGQHLKTKTLNMMIQTVKISPIGYHIDFKDLDDDTIKKPDKEDVFSEIPITLNLTNGKTMELSGGCSILASEEGYSYTHGGRFGKILPVDQMESICIGDILIKIPATH